MILSFSSNSVRSPYSQSAIFFLSDIVIKVVTKAPVPPSDRPPTQSATLIPVESCTFLTKMGGVTSLVVVFSRPQD